MLKFRRTRPRSARRTGGSSSPLPQPWLGLEALEPRILLGAGPIVTIAKLNDGTSQRSSLAKLAVSFDSNVGASLSLNDLILARRDTGLAVDLAGAALTYDPVTNTGTWSFTGLLAGRVPDGFYRAKLVASGITNGVGDHLDGNRDGTNGDDLELGLFQQGGDATGDGLVDAADLDLVRQNWLKAPGAFDPGADLNGDGKVNVFDLKIVHGNWLATVKPPTPLDRAETTADVAAALYYRPERMYEYVLNNVRYEPYAGSMKGALATLQTRGGNAWDQDALLISLLNEAGVYSRFVSAVNLAYVESPIQPVKDWLGVKDPLAAGSVLANAGLHPVRIIDGTGQTIAMRWDHTWVESFLPGASGVYQWKNMDPTWKFREFREGVADLITLVPFDEAGYLSQVRKDLAYEYYQDQVAAYLAVNKPGVSPADVPYDGPIIPQQVTAISGSLPYTITGTPAHYTQVPASWTHRVKVTLTDDWGWTTYFDQVLSLPQMCLDRVTVSYADAGSWGLYPQLRVGGEVIAQSADTVFDGDPVMLWIDQYNGDGNNAADASSAYGRSAGQYIAIGLDAGQISTTMLNGLQQTINGAAFTKLNGGTPQPDDQVGAFLARAVLGYFYEGGRGEQVIDGLTEGVGIVPRVASGIASSDTTVQYFEGLQNPYLPDGYSIDVANNVHQVISLDGDDTVDDDRRLIVDHNQSAQEHAIWEELAQTTSISTIKSLQLANSHLPNPIPVYTITKAQYPTKTAVRNLLNLSSATEDDIATRVVDYNEKVTVPRDPTPLNDWDGVGYIAESADGVSRAYVIYGGLYCFGSRMIQGGTPTKEDPDPTPPVGKGNNPNQPEVGDPINVANGNVTRDETDVSLPGIGLPLDFARHYDSQSGAGVGFGPGWVHSYSDLLTFNVGGSITWTNDVGMEFKFLPNGSGGYITPDTLHGTLTYASGLYTYRNKDGLKHAFDSAGRLTEIRDRSDNALSMSYDGGGKLLAVIDADAPARRLTLTYAGTLIATVSDFTGRTWTYGYSGGRLASVTTPSDVQTLAYTTQYAYYTDTARNGLLKQIAQADGGVIQYAYYPNGRGYQVIDPEGYSSWVSYDLFRPQSTFTDERGFSTIYEYNDKGNLIDQTCPDGAKESWVWVNSLVKSHTDPFGKAESFTYDSLGNRTQVIDRGGYTSTYTYEPVFSRMTLSALPGGRNTTFTYDAKGNLTGVQDALGGVTAMTYDSRGLMLSRTDPRGTATLFPGDFTTTFTYNEAGQILTRSTDLPSAESFTYDSRGDLLTSTNADGHTTAFAYDLLDRVLGTTDALGGTTSYVYGPLGGPTSTTDPLGRTTTFEWDRNQRLVRTSAADHAVSTRTYDPAGNLIASRDPLARVTRYQYDSRNRLVSTLLPDGTTGRTQYDGAGRAVLYRDGRGNATRYAYDALDRLTQIKDAVNNTASRTYDAVGNLTASSDFAGRTTDYTYDLLNRKLTETDDLNHTTTWEYDPVGNVLSVTDALGHPTRYTYDVLSRQTTIQDALNHTTTKRYDPAGDLISLTDPDGNTTTSAYDALERLSVERNALGARRTFAYDAVGNLAGSTDRDGRVTQFAYDSMNRQVEELWLGGGGTVLRSIRSTYDLAGQGTSLRDADAACAFTYDSLGRLTSVDNAGTPGAPRVVLSYAYDAAGNVLSMADNLGGTNSYTYDALNRMTKVTQSGTGVTAKRADFAYYADGRIDTITRYSNLSGTTLVAASDYDYDAVGRLTALTHAKGATTLAAYAWTFDAANRITQMTSPDGTSNFAYDDTDQLTATDHSYQPDEGYSYDDNGNRTNPGYATGPGNRMTSDGTYNCEYDNEGNRVRRTKISDGEITEYEWDYRDRLTRVVTKNAALTVIKDVRYSYDPLGRRIGKWVDADGAGPGGATIDRFVYDGQNIVLQFDGAGAATHRYLHGPGVDQVLGDQGAGGVVLWALSDHQGTVRDLINSAGVIQNHIKYDSFGKVTSESNPPAAILYGFTGRERDTETGLYYYRARYYDPGVGRFVSEDPTMFMFGDMNPYRYVGNDPLGFTDFMGWCKENTQEPLDGEEILRRELEKLKGLNWWERMRAIEKWHGGIFVNSSDPERLSQDWREIGKGRTFRIPDGQVLSAGDFGNWLAGYVGQHELGEFGVDAMRGGGVLWHLKETGKIGDDWTYINLGSRDAQSDMFGVEGFWNVTMKRVDDWLVPPAY